MHILLNPREKGQRCHIVEIEVMMETKRMPMEIKTVVMRKEMTGKRAVMRRCFLASASELQVREIVVLGAILSLMMQMVYRL